MVTDSHETDNRNYSLTATVAELSAAVDDLEARVDEGARRIAEATRIDHDADGWERFWTELLASYEDVYRNLAELQEGGE